MSTFPTLLATFVIVLATAWGALALWYRAPEGPGIRTACAMLWIALGLACSVALWCGRFAAGLAVYGVAHALFLIWWRSLRPSNEREWADDVSQTVGGKVEANMVTLDKVRDFVWRTNTDYVERWVPRRYDLVRLDSLDMIVSYWSRASIAHMLISFGFGGDQYVVFSVEIRRQKHQSFSELGGFFKEFEVVIIAAEERDIVRLRTNVRREQTYLFRLNFPPEVMRALFLSYVAEANELVRAPRFYHTISCNCTTVLYAMLKRIVGRLPVSLRILLSGYMPEYFYSIGRLDRRYPLEELRALGYISERGRLADTSPNFSADIRRGIPPL